MKIEVICQEEESSNFVVFFIRHTTVKSHNILSTALVYQNFRLRATYESCQIAGGTPADACGAIFLSRPWPILLSS
jgi:hypothetical protein